MQYHFGPELKIELCSFGEQCPADHHFATEREAASTLEQAERISDRNLRSPVTGVSGAELNFFLKTIADREPRNFFSNPVASLEYKHSEEKIQRVLMLLAREGILNAVHRTEVSFVDGIEKPKSSGIKWKVEVRNWGRDTVILASSLKLTDRGNKILDSFEAQAAESAKARKVISALKTDSSAILRFMEDLDRLVEHRDELLKRAGTKILDQVQQLIDETWGPQRLWTRAEIAEELGCSISTATDIATKLTAWGVLERTHRRDGFGPRSVIAYRIAVGPIAVLGGLSKIIADARASLAAESEKAKASDKA